MHFFIDHNTQSAIWIWNEGNRYNKKIVKEYADIDDVDSVSKVIKYDIGSFFFPAYPYYEMFLSLEEMTPFLKSRY